MLAATAPAMIHPTALMVRKLPKLQAFSPTPAAATYLNLQERINSQLLPFFVQLVSKIELGSNGNPIL